MQRYIARSFFAGLLLLTVILGAAGFMVSFDSSARHGADIVSDLGSTGRYYKAHDGALPPPGQLAAWIAQQEPVDQISLFGGDYWLFAEVLINQDQQDLVFDASNSLIQRVELRIDQPNGKQQALTTGYGAPRDFTLNYSKHLRLPEPGRHEVLVRFSSPYFSSLPRFELWQRPAYMQHALKGNVIALSCLGALACMAIFNFFMFVTTGARYQAYYSAYLLSYALGWAFVFNLPADLFGVTSLSWNYLPFFLLPVLNTLFYLEFLNIREVSPRLARWSRVNLVLPLLLLPSCFVALSWAHTLATIVIAIWIALALACGIACLRSDYRPARFFVPAFVALLIPAILILPANIGLMPDLVDNELFTLMGGTLDGLLLAFAVADRYRMVSEQKDLYLAQLNEALTLANTDALTGVGNRYAFDKELQEHFVFDDAEHDDEHLMVLIDLDGLKPINDRLGHAIGDELLRKVATVLKQHLEPASKVFRLGGDEFAILSVRAQTAHIETTLRTIDHDIVLQFSEDVGISYGIAYASESASPAILVTLADRRMYELKSTRKALRSRKT